MSSNPQDKPYHVRTDSGGLHSGHEGPQQAQEAADYANRQAEELGIKTRYVVRARA